MPTMEVGGGPAMPAFGEPTPTPRGGFTAAGAGTPPAGGPPDGGGLTRNGLQKRPPRQPASTPAPPARTPDDAAATDGRGPEGVRATLTAFRSGLDRGTTHRGTTHRDTTHRGTTSHDTAYRDGAGFGSADSRTSEYPWIGPGGFEGTP
jgi:hypothetical protein